MTNVSFTDGKGINYDGTPVFVQNPEDYPQQEAPKDRYIVVEPIDELDDEF